MSSAKDDELPDGRTPPESVTVNWLSRTASHHSLSEDPRFSIQDCQTFTLRAQLTDSQDAGDRDQSWTMLLLPYMGKTNGGTISFGRNISRLHTGVAARKPRGKGGRFLSRVLLPSSWMRVMFDLVSAIALTYDLTTTPLWLAFEGDGEPVFMWLSCVSLTIWVLDVLLNFRTGFYLKGELRTNPSEIARHYLKGGFALDVFVIMVDIVALAMKLVEQSAVDTDYAKILRIFKASRLMRLTNILRAKRLKKLIQHLRMWSGSISFCTELGAFVFAFLWLNHVIACVWCYLGNSARNADDTGETWLDQVTGSRGHLYSSFGAGYIYTTALHWAITQMTPGSMEVTPESSVERIFNVLCLVAGLLLFSTLISSISATVTNFKIQMQSHEEKMENLRNFLERVCVSMNLRILVYQQADMKLREQRPLVAKDLDVLNKLSLSLRSELQLELCDPLLKHPLLNFLAVALPSAWLKTCRDGADFSMFTKHDTLFLMSVEATGMHFITAGSMSYVWTADQDGAETETRVEVERGGWLSEAGLWCRWRHAGNAEVEAVRFCEVLTLDAEKVLKALMNQPLIGQVVLKYAQSFVNFLAKSRAPTWPRPTDLSLPFTIEHVIMAMPKEIVDIVSSAAISALRNHSAPESLLSIAAVRARHESLFGWGWHAKRDDKIQSLLSDSQSGRSMLLLTKERELGVERCIARVVLRLRRGDGRILTSIRAEVNGNGCYPEIVASLPSRPQAAGEYPDDCAQRLLEEQVSPLQEDFEVYCASRSSDIDSSQSFGVLTRCAETMITADWTGSDAALEEYKLDKARKSNGSNSLPPMQNTRSGSRVFMSTLSLRGSMQKEPSHMRVSRDSANSDTSGSTDHTSRTTSKVRMSITSRSMQSPTPDRPDWPPSADLLSFPGGFVFTWLTEEELLFCTGARGKNCLDHWIRSQWPRAVDILWGCTADSLASGVSQVL